MIRSWTVRGFALIVALIPRLQEAPGVPFELNTGLGKTFAGIAAPSAVAFSPDGSKLAFLDKAGTLHLVDAAGAEVAKAEGAHKPGDSAIAFSPLRDTLATWGPDETVKFWSASTVAPVQSVPVALSKARVIAFSGDGSKLACGDDKGSVAILAGSPWAVKATLVAGKGRVAALAFEPSGSSIVVVTADQFLRAFSLNEPGKPLREKKLPRTEIYQHEKEPEYQQIRSASCTPNGSVFAIGAYKWVNVLGGPPREFEFIVLYDRTGRRLYSIESVKKMSNMSLAVAISPDAQLVAAQGADGSLRIWPAQQRGDPLEVPKVGTIRGIACTQRQGRWLFGVAASSALLVGVTAPDAPAASKQEPPAAERDGLAISFLNPAESTPIVGSADLEVAVAVSGVRDRNPKWSIDIAGQESKPTSLEPSDSRALVLAPATEEEGGTGKPTMTQLADGVFRVAQNLKLFVGPNRIKVAIRDGSRLVELAKTVYYVPEGDLDRSKIYANSYAVVIGINRYKPGPAKIPDLKCAAADAQAVADVLKARFGFKSENVEVLLDEKATKSAIMNSLNRLADARLVHPNDRVVVFFSGHGQTVAPPDGAQVGFLIPYDAAVDFANLDNLQPYRETCIRMSELGTLAADTPAKHVLFLLDACFSGFALDPTQRYAKEVFKMPYQAYFDAKQVITASSRFEAAKEANGHGYFTKALLDAFAEPAADANGDGLLTAAEIYDYLKPKVQSANSNQSPRMGKYTSGTGESLFLR